MGVNTLIKEAKREYKANKKKIKDAERVLNILEDAGVNVLELKQSLRDMKKQSKLLGKAFKKDKERQQQSGV